MKKVIKSSVSDTTKNYEVTFTYTTWTHADNEEQAISRSVKKFEDDLNRFSVEDTVDVSCHLMSQREYM